MAGRLTRHYLIEMREKTINQCLEKKMKWKQGAEILSMHPKSFSRLKRKYLEYGRVVLEGRKPGPKKGHAWNKTLEEIEEKVTEISLNHQELGPSPLAEELEKERIYLHPTTIWRILKRNKIRYTSEYKKWKPEPQLYALDEPGEEIQMDGCYPYGRARKLVSFDAVDDCSRFGFGRYYEHEDADSAIDFITRVVEKAPFRVQKVRVDNRYGKRFREYCEKELGLEVIENDPYEATQNGKVERYHGTMKKLFFFRSCSFTDDFETLNYKYSLWLHWYNYQRPHTGYKMHKMSPAQKIASCYLMLLANRLLENKKVTGTLQQNISCIFFADMRK